MIFFDNNEFEIAIVTYNRANFVKEWLENCFKDIVARNILLSIYDSSTNDDTQTLIFDFIEIQQVKIEYHRVDKDIIIGYKPMLPILNSHCKYLWVSGDSRYHDFDELDRNVFRFLKDGEVDYVTFKIVNNAENLGQIYTDKSRMLRDFFVSTTCIGLSIYKTSLFDPIRNNAELLRQYDSLFADNYGFGWLGYFYSVYSMGNYHALFADVKIYDIQPERKAQSWFKRFYGCWAEDLCQIIDNIPDSFDKKELVPIETWKVLELDSIPYCYKARKYGDLNKRKIRILLEDGILERVTQRQKRIKFWACSPMAVIEIGYFVYKCCRKVFRFLQGTVK